MKLTVSPCLLILAALVALAWRFRGPVLRAMYRARASLLRRRIERDIGMPLVCLVGAVDQDSAPVWCAKLRAVKPGPLAVLLHTYGGNSDARARVGRAVAQHRGLVSAHVPEFAWSAGCAIALACDRVFMGVDSVLGPIDPSKKADDGGLIFCASEVAAHDAQAVASVRDSRTSLDECEAALRANRAARRAMFSRYQTNRVEWNAETGATVDTAGVLGEVIPDPDAMLVSQLVRGGWGNHWRPIFIEDAQALGIDARPENPAMHPRLAELARLTLLSLKECDR